MMPSSGRMNVLNAASTRAGLASQRTSSPSRGKSPPNIANKQPILLTSCLVLHCPPRQGYRFQVASFLLLCMTLLEHKPRHGGRSSPRDAYPLDVCCQVHAHNSLILP